MKKILTTTSAVVFSAIAALSGCSSNDSNSGSGATPNSNDPVTTTDTNTISDDRMLLVLSAPAMSTFELDEASLFRNIVSFQINYAQKVIEAGEDNIIVLVDEATRSDYSALPDDVLLTVADGGLHIWARDYTTVNPYNPVGFTYTWSTMSKAESENVQARFNQFLAQHSIERQSSDYRLDGGNIVDNYAGDAITTNRFVTDNQLTRTQAKENLKSLLNADAIAIVEPDEETMAHSDGMVMWLDNKTLLVNNYTNVEGFGADYHQGVMEELTNSFPEATVIEVPVQFSDDPNNESSSCGINLNSVMTPNALYVPVFGGVYTDNEKQVLSTIRSNTDKPVVEVEANGVCDLGGSVRCLTWQLTGENAKKLILAARND